MIITKQEEIESIRRVLATIEAKVIASNKPEEKLRAMAVKLLSRLRELGC